MISHRSSRDAALFSNSLKDVVMMSTWIPVLLVNWGSRVLRADMVGGIVGEHAQGASVLWVYAAYGAGCPVAGITAWNRNRFPEGMNILEARGFS